MSTPSKVLDDDAIPLRKPAPRYSPRWFVGMLQAAFFSAAYFVAPFYMLSALIMLIAQYPSFPTALLYALPILVSAVVPPVASPSMIRMFQSMLDYFDYDQIHERSPIDTLELLRQGKKNYLLVCQPHGVLSYCAIGSAITAPTDLQGKIPTAVADAVLCTPILKHVLGIFGLTSASKANLVRLLQKPGYQGTVVLYVGGMAELFLSSTEKEQLYLQKRKGFIKLALQTGTDIIPIYLFGNTIALSILKGPLLSSVSRKLQVAFTYFWGVCGLPIPRDVKLLYVSGQPLGIPSTPIPQPTQEQIDEYHDKYCKQVHRIFDTYKERVPGYKHKTLEIL